MVNKELYHFGTKGMKWGVRRYQNKNGSLTNAGKKRYSKPSEDHIQAQEIRKKKLSEMSNKELKDLNNRLQLETNYKNLTRRKSRIKQAVKAFTGTATTITMIMAASKVYKNVGNSALDKIGDWVIKDMKNIVV